MRIGIDFDEVIADTIEMIARLHNERYGTHFTRDHFSSYRLQETWGGTLEDAIKKLDALFAEDQIREIAPTPGSLDAIRLLKKRGHDLYVVTGRSSRDAAQTERWLNHHLPGIFSGIEYGHFFTLDTNLAPRKKSDICRDLGIELLIDDNLPTVLESAEGGLAAFLFDQPWNREAVLPRGVTRVRSWDEIAQKINP